ncbi:MAG: hypothetical protein PVH52_01100 [bacterium]
MKTLTELRCVYFLVVPLLAALLLVSCSDPESPPLKDDSSYDRSTPDNLLLMLANSYKEMELDDYADCLDEDFLFVFFDEIADSMGLPPEEPWWGKTEDIACTGNMFEDPVVQSVAFTYEAMEEWSPHQEVRPDTTYSGLFRRVDPIIEVTVSTPSEYYETLTYRVVDSWLDVVVVPDRYTEGLWCILRIDEFHKVRLQASLASGCAATESSSWGGIKSLWAEQ